MKKIGGILIAIFALVISAVVVKYGVDEYRQYNDASSFDAAIQEVKGKLDSAVNNDTSDRTDTEKLYDASQEMMSERLNTASGNSPSNDDMAFAAGVFAGQYGRMVVFTKEYCKTIGVDVSEFSSSYKATHIELYIKADKILKGNGSNIPQVYNSTREMVLPYIEKEAADIRAMFISQTGDDSFTLVDSCEYYNQIARDPAAMNSVKFSNVAPDPFRILMRESLDSK